MHSAAANQTCLLGHSGLITHLPACHVTHMACICGLVVWCASLRLDSRLFIACALQVHSIDCLWGLPARTKLLRWLSVSHCHCMRLLSVCAPQVQAVDWLSVHCRFRRCCWPQSAPTPVSMSGGASCTNRALFSLPAGPRPPTPTLPCRSVMPRAPCLCVGVRPGCWHASLDDVGCSPGGHLYDFIMTNSQCCV